MTFLSALANRGEPRCRRIGRGRASWWMRIPGGRRSSGSPPARRRCSACGATARRCIWRSTPRRSPSCSSSACPVPERRFPSVAVTHPPALRLERTIRDLYGLEPEGVAGRAPLARPRPLGRALAARHAGAGTRHRRRLRVPHGRRPAAAPDPGRPRARRHHRARPLPLQLQRRGRGAPGGAAGLRAQGHRRPDARRPAGQGGEARRPRVGRQHGGLRHRLRPRRGGGARPRAAAARHLSARADGRAGTPRQPLRRHRRHLQRRLLLAHPRPLRHPARARAARLPMPASATA